MDLLALGSVFDWISPLLAFAQNMGKGPTYTFLVPWSCGWSGRELKRLLKGRGVNSWGYMVIDNTITLTVQRRQANWTQCILDQSGIPVENPMEGTLRARR